MALALLLLGLVLLPGCRGPDGGQSPKTPLSPTRYPDLAGVPVRPKLSYSVEQRQEIARSLVADREHAQHAKAELAYATGKGAKPPPPPPPKAARPAAAEPPAPAAAPPAGDGGIAQRYVDAALDDARDERDLEDFVRRLERQPPDAAGPATVGEALDRFGSVFGGVLGVETGGTAATAPAAPVPFGSVVARLTFPPDGAALDPAASRQLEGALAVAKAANGALRVVAAPADSPLAEARARAVAQGLERLGAEAVTVETAAGGSGEETLVYLVRRPAA